MPQTEDIEYSVDPFAIADEETKTDDPEQTVNDVAIKEIDEYLKKAIREHNTFDAINLPANATPAEKIAAFDMMAIHKGLIMHLRQIRTIISGIGKEN